MILFVKFIFLFCIPMAVVYGFFPRIMPFDLFYFWNFSGSLGEVIGASLPIYIWAFLITYVNYLACPSYERAAYSDFDFGFSLKASLTAGIGEEFAFRWVLFYSEIWFIQFLSQILFHFPQWFYETINGPIANFLTFGLMNEYLLGGLGWAVGGAILYSNGKFQEEHSYLGWFGWVNSWCMGMFFFWIMFHSGLFAAMFSHFTYDLLIFGMYSIFGRIERAKMAYY